MNSFIKHAAMRRPGPMLAGYGPRPEKPKKNMSHAGLRARLALQLLTMMIILLPGANQALACASCGCTVSREWNTQGITSTPGWSVEVTYDTLDQNRQRYGTSKASSAQLAAISAAGGEVEDFTVTDTVTTRIDYTGDAWGMSLQIPYVTRRHGTYGSGWPGTSQYLTSTQSGIGDIRLLGHYSGFSGDNSTGVIAGVKLPTGSNSAYFSDGTTPLDAGLQIGTGSTDTILGAYTSGALGMFGWFLQGTWQHAVATQTGLAGVSYRPGDAYSLNAGIRHSRFGARFVPMLQLNFIKRNIDTGTGVPTDPITGVSVSGGTLLYLTPGITYRLGGGFSAYGFAQLPVYRKVNSLQLTPNYILSLGIRYRL